MAKETITRSPLVAGFMAVAIGLQSPAGHDAVYQGLLRIRFAPQWIVAMRQTGEPMRFETFKNSDMLQFWIYDPNPDVFLNNMRLLNEDFSFCLPFVNNTEDQPKVPQNFFACHAPALREEKQKNRMRLAFN